MRLDIDSRRYVGAQIGIFSPAGEKVGRVSHLRTASTSSSPDRTKAPRGGRRGRASSRLRSGWHECEHAAGHGGGDDERHRGSSRRAARSRSVGRRRRRRRSRACHADRAGPRRSRPSSNASSSRWGWLVSALTSAEAAAPGLLVAVSSRVALPPVAKGTCRWSIPAQTAASSTPVAVCAARRNGLRASPEATGSNGSNPIGPSSGPATAIALPRGSPQVSAVHAAASSAKRQASPSETFASGKKVTASAKGKRTAAGRARVRPQRR